MIKSINFEWLPGERQLAEEALQEILNTLTKEVNFNDVMKGEDAIRLIGRHEYQIKGVMNNLPFPKKAFIAALNPASPVSFAGEDGHKMICDIALEVIKRALTHRLNETLQFQY